MYRHLRFKEAEPSGNEPTRLIEYLPIPGKHLLFFFPRKSQYLTFAMAFHKAQAGCCVDTGLRGKAWQASFLLD